MTIVHPAPTAEESAVPPGMRPLTKQEWNDACSLRDNFADPSSADRDCVRILPLARQRLENAIAGLADMQFEVRTRKRRLTAADGQVHEVPSPFFVDDLGRDEDFWRRDAAQVRAEIAATTKAGPSRDEAELQALCDLRLREATSQNTADRIAFNPTLLRRVIADLRHDVQHFEAELAEYLRRARPYL